MKLRKDNEADITICDNCLEIRQLTGIVYPLDLTICSNCCSKPITQKNCTSIHILKWYMVLYKYKEQGYELV